MNIQYKLNQMAQLFEMITTQLKSVVNVAFIQSIKTLKGNTQSSERVVIQKIRDVFKDLGLSYEEAGSQQSNDFRNVGGIGLNIEIKKNRQPQHLLQRYLPMRRYLLYSLPEKNINQKKAFHHSYCLSTAKNLCAILHSRLYPRNDIVKRQIRPRPKQETT